MVGLSRVMVCGFLKAESKEVILRSKRVRKMPDNFVVMPRKVALLDQPIETFRIRFARIFAVVMAWASPIGVVVCVARIVLEDGTNTNILALLIGILAGLIVGAFVGLVLTAISVAYFKVHVYPNRIRSCDFWGVYREQEWSDIEMIRPINFFFGLKFIRLNSKSKSNVVWLPLFLTDLNRFNELVSQYAESDNPLAQYLTQNVP